MILYVKLLVSSLLNHIILILQPRYGVSYTDYINNEAREVDRFSGSPPHFTRKEPENIHNNRSAKKFANTYFMVLTALCVYAEIKLVVYSF